MFAHRKHSCSDQNKPGHISASPSCDGPWTQPADYTAFSKETLNLLFHPLLSTYTHSPTPAGPLNTLTWWNPPFAFSGEAKGVPQMQSSTLGTSNPLSTERLLCFNLTPWLVCKPVSPACRSAAELGPHLCGEVALMKPHSSTSVNKSWANHRHTSCPADF